MKNRILVQAQKELKEKTDISFNFEEIKTGRKITSLKFIIKQNKDLKNEIAATSTGIIKGQQSIDDTFNVKTVKGIINNLNDDGAMAIFNAANGDIQKIKEKYSVISKFRNVHNLTGAMIQAIREDWATNNINKSTFNNFEGRTYDYEELEKKLLGWE
jgi:plasmid replication initiation protein